MCGEIVKRLELFKSRLSKILDVRATLSLLRWDEEVYMPKKGAQARGRHLKTLSEILHQLETSPELGDDLSYLQDNLDKLTGDDQILVQEVSYDYQRAKKLPTSWVGKFAESCSKAYHAWIEARQYSRFDLFHSDLTSIVHLCQQKAEYLGYTESPYNALLEDFERGMDVKTLDTIFNELGPRQSELFQQILSLGTNDKNILAGKTWDTSKQWSITLHVLEAIGFNFEAGRQDYSVHPFTTNIGADDVRITTRLNPNNMFSGLFSSLHEGGHALYEQGFKDEDKNTWLAQAPSLGIHESQSRFWEYCIGHSLAFCHFLLPILRKHYSAELHDITPEELYREINRVSMNFIRVEADECAYNLHIILRYKIEKDLIEGNLSVAEVPEQWNAIFTTMFGMRPPNDAQGCLQDIHWAHGAFGYFPSYALGNLYAVQLLEKINEQLDIEDLVRKGEFYPIRKWLQENIYHIGRRKLSREIIEEATTKPISAHPFLNYLYEKYNQLYY